MTLRAMILMVNAVVIMMIAVYLLPIGNSPESFSKERARIDIKWGRVHLITFGFDGPTAETQKIAARYGFKEVGFGCEVMYSPEEKEYDRLINKFLEKRNGKNWRAAYNKEKEFSAR